jgi:hypothetical protein
MPHHKHVWEDGGTARPSSTLAGGAWSVSPSCCFPPGIKVPVPNGYEDGWAPERVHVMEKRIILTLPGKELWSPSPLL